MIPGTNMHTHAMGHPSTRAPATPRRARTKHGTLLTLDGERSPGKPSPSPPEMPPFGKIRSRSATTEDKRRALRYTRYVLEKKNTETSQLCDRGFRRNIFRQAAWDYLLWLFMLLVAGTATKFSVL